MVLGTSSGWDCERDTNELGNRTLVDRRGSPRNIARSAQTARAAKATTARDSPLGGGRRSCAGKPRTNGGADRTHLAERRSASVSRNAARAVAREARAEACPKAGVCSRASLRSTVCRLTKGMLPIAVPKNPQRFRSEYASRVLFRPSFAQLVFRFVARAPQPIRKKEIPGTEVGKKFANPARHVAFTRLMRPFSRATKQAGGRPVTSRRFASGVTHCRRGVPTPTSCLSTAGFARNKPVCRPPRAPHSARLFTSQAFVLTLPAIAANTLCAACLAAPRRGCAKLFGVCTARPAMSKLEHEPCLSFRLLACPLHLCFRVPGCN
jgi:hypothetical protein